MSPPKKLSQKIFLNFPIGISLFLVWIFLPTASFAKYMDIFPEIIQEQIFSSNSHHAIVLGSQNSSGKLEVLRDFLKDSPQVNHPVIEFKKINPTKYNLRIHQIETGFFVIFSETFHTGWKIYPMSEDIDSVNLKLTSLLEKNKIFKNNLDYQADMDDIREFINKGWISSLGDGRAQKQMIFRYLENGRQVIDHLEIYYSDFISKKFHNSIQNNNLTEGSLSETWGKKYVNEKYHLKTNGFSNMWLVDLNYIKKNFQNSLFPNEDGTYDLKLILEFSPQKLLYFSLFLSGITLLASQVYLICFLIKKLTL